MNTTPDETGPEAAVTADSPSAIWWRAVPTRDDALAAARQMREAGAGRDAAVGDVRRTVAQTVWLLRELAPLAALAAATWVAAVAWWGWPHDQAWRAAAVVTVAGMVLSIVTDLVRDRVEPRREVDLILSPSSLHNSARTLAAQESADRGRLAFDAAPWQTAGDPDRAVALLRAGVRESDALIVVAPMGRLDGPTRGAIRHALRRGVPVRYWHDRSARDSTEGARA